MRAWLAVACVAVMASAAALARAQAPADFSGAWTLDAPAVGGTAAVPGTPAAAAAPGDLGSGWGPAITIQQDAARLRVEDPVFSRYDLQPALTFTYPLDGSEGLTTVMVGRGEQVQSSRARWDGAVLVIVTTFRVGDPAARTPFTFEVTRRLSLESPTTLAVETSRAGALGGTPSSTRAIYRKRS